MEGLTLQRSLLASSASVLAVRALFVFFLNVAQVSGSTMIQALFVIACIGALFVIKEVVMVRIGKALLLWLCYLAGEVAGSLLAFSILSGPLDGIWVLGPTHPDAAVSWTGEFGAGSERVSSRRRDARDLDSRTACA